MMQTIFKAANIYCGGEIVKGDLAVENGVIAAIGGDIVPSTEDRVIDASSLMLVSGLVDVHVHLREPGFAAKETIATGTTAAARGGYTTVCAMPNLSPAPDSVENLSVELDLIDRHAVIEVLPYGTITKGRKGGGEPADFGAMKELVAGFSDDGCGVQDEVVMEEAMRCIASVDGILAAHCEVDSLLRGGYIHDGEYCRMHGHKGICSESEWRQVERDIELVAKTGCRYHVCHVSTKESVELIRRAKAAGLDVSGETAPHYLLLCDEDIEESGRFKMNPPLRSRADRDAIIEGVIDGTIEIIATDHAPHTADEKSRGLAASAMGVVGLECAFPVLYTYLVKRGVITLERLVALMTDNPRKRFGIKGGIEVGQRADVTLFDLDAEYTIDPNEFLSKGRSTPFEGWSVWGRTMLTMAQGRVVYVDEKYKEQKTI